MAKKRFTDGLSNLFDNPFDEPATPQQPSLEANEESIDIDIPLKNEGARSKLSSKGFTNDLDAFLSDSFEREAAKDQLTPNRRKKRSGLDLLIRSTVSADDEDRNPRGGKTPDTKRVTLIFRKDHLAELKDLAKTRKMYLKDLVQEMVSGYLSE